MNFFVIEMHCKMMRLKKDKKKTRKEKKRKENHRRRASRAWGVNGARQETRDAR
jgi:hypothetical protein